MKRLRLDLLFALLAAALLPALKAPAEETMGTSYRLEYSIRGGAISRLLFIFPLRVFYEASAAVDLTAISQEDGSVCFSFARVPRTCFILRTLGFSGKTLALLTVGTDIDDEVLKEAVKFRKNNKKRDLSYADCIGYIYSKLNGIKFLTGDRQFSDMQFVEFVK